MYIGSILKMEKIMYTQDILISNFTVLAFKYDKWHKLPFEYDIMM